MLKQRANDLAEGRISKEDLKKEQVEILNKYNKYVIDLLTCLEKIVHRL
jgi:hypothetical protein